MKELTIITTKSITFNRFLLELSSSLNKKFNVVLCCKDSNNINCSLNFIKKDIQFPSSLWELFNFKKSFKMINQISNLLDKSDLIYLHTPLASHLVRFVNIFYFKKIKIIYHIHGLRYLPGIWTIKSLFFRLIEFILSFKTDKFIAINSQDYKSLTKFIPIKKIHLIKGVGVNLPIKGKVKSLPNPDQTFVVGVIAAFKKEKGYRELVKVAKYCQINPNINFRVFGYGKYDWVLKLIEEEGLNNIQLKGYVKNIENEIDKFNLFMLPSYREGLNVSIQECLSKGVPVLTTNVRGCRDLIVNGYNGYLYEKYDVISASNEILNIAHMNKSSYSKLSSNCLEYSKVFLARDKKNEEIMKVFEEFYV